MPKIFNNTQIENSLVNKNNCIRKSASMPCIKVDGLTNIPELKLQKIMIPKAIAEKTNEQKLNCKKENCKFFNWIINKANYFKNKTLRHFNFFAILPSAIIQLANLSKFPFVGMIINIPLFIGFGIANLCSTIIEFVNLKKSMNVVKKLNNPNYDLSNNVKLQSLFNNDTEHMNKTLNEFKQFKSCECKKSLFQGLLKTLDLIGDMTIIGTTIFCPALMLIGFLMKSISYLTEITYEFIQKKNKKNNKLPESKQELYNNIEKCL